MSLFWVIAALLLLLAMWMVVGTLWRKPARGAPGAKCQPVEPGGAEGAVGAGRPGPGRGRASTPHSTRPRAPRSNAAWSRRKASPPHRCARARRAPRCCCCWWRCRCWRWACTRMIGTPAALSPQAAMARRATPSSHEVEAMVAKLAERMEKQPPGNVADTEGWVMLGRSYAVMQRYPEASRAFGARAAADARRRADPGRPGRRAGHAARRQPRGRADAADRAGAEEQPVEPEGRWRWPAPPPSSARTTPRAIDYWGRARAAAPPDSEFARSLEQSMAEARAAGRRRSRGSGPAGGRPRPAGRGCRAAQAQGAASISGRVSLSPALAARVGGRATRCSSSRAPPRARACRWPS